MFYGKVHFYQCLVRTELYFRLLTDYSVSRYLCRNSSVNSFLIIGVHRDRLFNLCFLRLEYLAQPNPQALKSSDAESQNSSVCIKWLEWLLTLFNAGLQRDGQIRSSNSKKLQGTFSLSRISAKIHLITVSLYRPLWYQLFTFCW